MQWTDIGYVIAQQKFSENSAILAILTKNHGLHKGLVRGSSSKSKRGICQAGNMVSATWKARLDGHLGNFSLEPVSYKVGSIMGNYDRLSAFNALCAVLYRTLPEREIVEGIYESFAELLENIISGDSWRLQYVKFEVALLARIGYGLELDKCAVTGQTNNLTHISPKTGRAVSFSEAQPYINKLLKLPSFLLAKNDNSQATNNELKEGLAIGQYFLNKYIFEPHGYQLPAARQSLSNFF